MIDVISKYQKLILDFIKSFDTMTVPSISEGETFTEKTITETLHNRHFNHYEYYYRIHMKQHIKNQYSIRLV